MSICIEPKKKPEVPLQLKVTHDTMLVLQEYSVYTGYDINELIIQITDQLLDDENFIKHFSGKRSNKKIMSIYGNHLIKTNENDFTPINIDDSEIPFK